MTHPCGIDFSKHKLTVLHDDGLYRHLRGNEPGTYIFGFDVVTWPGYLTICGDAGDYTFARLTDMFEFFESSRGDINPYYWGQKLQGVSDQHRRYSPELFEEKVWDWYREACAGDLFDDELSMDDRQDLRTELEHMISVGRDHEFTAHTSLSDFEWRGHTFGDSFEWDLRDYDQHFLNCCWAIIWAIEQYRGRPKVEINILPCGGAGSAGLGFAGAPCIAPAVLAQAVQERDARRSRT